jgi:peroxiredoxin family protein
MDAVKKGGLESAVLPGIMRLGTGMMKRKIEKSNVPTLPKLLEMARMTDKVKLYACSTTMELMGIQKEDLIPEVDEIVGAATFLSIAQDCDVQLFI